ncbi:uncharacterized protein BDW47DRAFT_71274 [Aspergillus candidus]|uniref:Uncharacterized protein n=1 Tax=Aspergillus candidus TaxID=41067 RepID=A0A2I2F2E7_ASPCN|nr:hypothetical protein BDW47DRAFT_71274 [Aspergillus candidus]PLB34815.1 hypothetical protein BDW47DRAFT_71274 [Aspergillus candidus]
MIEKAIEEVETLSGFWLGAQDGHLTVVIDGNKGMIGALRPARARVGINGARLSGYREIWNYYIGEERGLKEPNMRVRGRGSERAKSLGGSGGNWSPPKGASESALANTIDH